MMLSGKRVLVTGAARGLGAAFAESLLKAGARVVIADVLEAEGRATAARLASLGEITFVQVDLGDPLSISHCAKAAVETLGGLDGLVNNGAIATNVGGKRMEDVEIDLFDRVLRVNVRGTWLMTSACLTALKVSGAGRIVNIASDTALWGAPKLMAYVASKGAVISMTRSMARELGEFNIAVNAVAPGLTKVEATEYVPKERHDLYAAGRAMSRTQMPEDITGVINFLLSDAARFVTGQLLPVNGGFVFN
jgi:NAD(P)-dependent dehydrogenase (short-subunit alcohol dehydrogenase family)